MIDTVYVITKETSAWYDTVANWLQGIGTIIAIIGLFIAYRQLRKELRLQHDSLELEKHKRKSLIQPFFDLLVYDSNQFHQVKLNNLGGRAMEIKLTIGENLHADFGDSVKTKKFVDTNDAITFNFLNVQRKNEQIAYIKFVLEYKDIDGNKYSQDGVAYSDRNKEISLPKEV